MFTFLKQTLQSVESKKAKIFNPTPIRSVSSCRPGFIETFDIINKSKTPSTGMPSNIFSSSKTPNIINKTSSNFSSFSIPSTSTTTTSLYVQPTSQSNTDMSFKGYSLVSINVSDDDSSLDIDKLFTKYRLHYIKAVKFILDTKMLTLHPKQLTKFTNCFFKLMIKLKTMKDLVGGQWL